MKLILSRKGFDAGYGRKPSPILPDGTLVPLPIPSEDDMNTMADINLPGIDIGGMIADLIGGDYGQQTTVHLDPDLDRSPGQRLAGWRPALGQSGIAQNHLQAQGVGVDDEDVFLFYGWFRQVDHARGAWRYRRGAPHLHVIFGWLEVGDVLPIVLERDRCLREHPWIENHPHVRIPAHYNDPRNTLYVAANQSRYAPEPFGGGGRFRNFADGLQLTRPNSSRSIWSLPDWFMPRDGRPPLTYNRNPAKWHEEGGRAILHSNSIGQEFVLDCDYYPEAGDWIGETILAGIGV